MRRPRSVVLVALVLGLVAAGCGTPATDDPAEGEVAVRGDARVFEATFGIRLLGADGATIEETFVTASEGAPGRGPWEHVFDIRGPGRYTVEVEEDDPSDGEGRPPFVLRRDIEVR